MADDEKQRRAFCLNRGDNRQGNQTGEQVIQGEPSKKARRSSRGLERRRARGDYVRFKKAKPPTADNAYNTDERKGAAVSLICSGNPLKAEVDDEADS